MVKLVLSSLWLKSKQNFSNNIRNDQIDVMQQSKISVEILTADEDQSAQYMQVPSPCKSNAHDSHNEHK